MTPKEKANELVTKMFNVDLDCKNESMCMLYPHALLCALIAVDEIIENEKIDNLEDNNLSYWQEVKTEIENLKF
jgi:hypothetical protein